MRHFTRAVTIAVMTGLSVIAPAAAHHSTAIYDTAKSVALEGTVKEFKLTNPHSVLQISVTDANGAAVTWSLECGGVYALSRVGLKAGIFNPGDSIKVRFNPMKDGTAMGNLRWVAKGETTFSFEGAG